MKKKSLWLIVLMVCALIAPFSVFTELVSGKTDANKIIILDKKRDKITHLHKIINATYSVISVSLYGDHENSDYGTVLVTLGRGTVLDHKGQLFFLSANHVINSSKIKKSPRPFLLARKLFLVPEWMDVHAQRYGILTYFSYFDNDRSLPPSMKDSDLTVPRSVFDDYSVAPDNKKIIPIDFGVARYSFEVDSGYVILNNNLKERLNCLTIVDFDFNFDWKIGRSIGIFGAPYSFGEWYREGVVASDYVGGPNFTKNNNFAFISLACAPGDSGGIIISLESGKIVGIVSGILTLKDPSFGISFPNGLIIKINTFFQKLEILKE